MPPRHSFAAPPVAVASLLLTATGYFALGWLTYLVDASGGGPEGFWPGAGLALAASLIAGPTTLLPVGLADTLLQLHSGHSPGRAALHAAGVCTEILLARWVLTRLRPTDWRFERVGDVVCFIAGAVLLSIASCLLGSALADRIWPGGPSLALPAALAMALGHGLGILLVAPGLLAWHADRSPMVRPRELAALLGACGASVAFGVGVSAGWPLLYALFPLILWAALRFGARELKLVLLLAGGAATMLAAARNAGGGPEQLEARAAVMLFLLVAGASGLLLAAALAERATSSRRLIESERLQRSLLHQMAEGVVLLDTDGRVEHASDRFCAIAGRTRDRVLGSQIEDLVQGADRERVAQAIRRGGQGQPIGVESCMVRPPEQLRVLWLTPRPLLDEAGGSRGTLVVVADVTERRRAEEQARRHLQQLAHLGRLKALDQMARSIAHEISQPLTAIATYAKAAQRFLAAGAQGDVAGALEGIDAAARHAGGVLQRVRGFTRNHAPQRLAIEPGRLIGEVAGLIEAEVRQAAIHLIADCSLLQPRVHADAIQIQQVLLNLIHNALESIVGAVGSRREIRVWASSPAQGEVVFHVADSGPGVPDGQRVRLFEPFHSSKEHGLGIGLAISRSIAEAHGGTLELDPEPREGATFRLSLPACHTTQVPRHA